MAGGPQAPTGNGNFLKWNVANPVAYRIDPGTLGTVTHDAGAQLVRDAFGRWDAVPTSAITSQDAGLLSVDVDAGNYLDFFSPPRSENSIIFDADGLIIEDIAGAGSSNSILGFAGPQAASGGFITYGVAVLNGKLANRAGFAQTVTHELGHLLGLDHTQINSFLGVDTPLMFPVALNGQSAEPQRDERAWISFLYPEPDFSTTTGTIRGRVMRRSGHYLFGANVVAVKLEPDGQGGFTESRPERVSAVSDLLLTGSGEFVLPGLVPGQYAVFVEPLNPTFTAGSGVGPFDSRPSVFPKDYYNGADESGDPAVDDPTLFTPIQVQAGQTVERIDLYTNNAVPQVQETVTFDLDDDDSARFEFPDDFAFPFGGKVLHSVNVNSDGNLTFLLPDRSFDPRTRQRLFRDRIPRIAPLLTDLDPSKGGQVQAVYQPPGQVTFQWVGVPEYVDPPSLPPPGNTFSVTLFSTGDIRFQYDSIPVTPDPDLLLATVAVDPGFFTGAPVVPETDLSAQPQPIAFGTNTVFEEFLGAGFDLTGQTLDFEAPKTELYFPFYQGDANFFTGFAATDFSTADAVLTLESRQQDGTLSGFNVNPDVETLNSQAQFARVGTELFGVDFDTVQNGWVRMTSSAEDLASFFQFGNGLSGSITKLDGGVAVEQQAATLYFTRVFNGPVFGTTSGFLQAQTTLSIANPNDSQIRVQINYVLPTGQDALSTVTRFIPAYGVLRGTVANLFNTSEPIDDGHIRVTVTQGPGAVGFELIELPNAIFGLNAQPAGTTSTVYSAQLAHGGTGDVFSFTDLKVINTSNGLRQVTITAIDEEGAVIGELSNLILNPNQSLQRRVGDLFGLGFPTGPIRTGSIIVEAGEPGVIGDVIFGDPVLARNAAALALQSDLFTKAVFSQVSNGMTNPADPTTNAFTGLALFNPGLAAAQVTIRVFTPQGVLVGETTLQLQGGFRISDLVENFIPATASQVGGYIVLESTVPIVAQMLFGNDLLPSPSSFLSAVPPRVVE